MFMLDARTKEYGPLSVNITCSEEKISFWGLTKKVSFSDFCMEVPTTRVKFSLLSCLNKEITIKMDPVNIQGIITGYTIEGDFYIIAIEILKASRSTWKSLLVEKNLCSLGSQVSHASS